jgi:hypothetical protein
MTRDRRSKLDDPTAEHTADGSTQKSGGLGRSPDGPGAERYREAEDLVPRTPEEHDTTPRRYDQRTEDDPVMPPDGPSLRTEI